ncbi:hypothetical protein OG824_04205 [Streptomyces prunicolor]|uniref:hypothetical protein n=1 Tax=Streptomyces prunicolor TaxID=67348 RepID=UPI002258305F|nr:hypothetical protein [Streptomyces prunicolor]MCX5234436.1 hypothetical protein [Streptomyces prunicolor]
MVGLVISGGVLQLVGLAMAALGVRKTRRQYAPEKRGVLGQVKQTVLTLWTETRGLFQRDRDVAATMDGQLPKIGADFGVVSETEDILKGPNMTTSPEERDNHLFELIAALDGKVRQIEAGQTRERDERQSAVRGLSEEVTDQVDKAQNAVREAKVDGLGLEAWGLTFAVVGLILSTIGSSVS